MGVGDQYAQKTKAASLKRSGCKIDSAPLSHLGSSSLRKATQNLSGSQPTDQAYAFFSSEACFTGPTCTDKLHFVRTTLLGLGMDRRLNLDLTGLLYKISTIIIAHTVMALSLSQRTHTLWMMRISNQPSPSSDARKASTMLQPSHV